MTQMIELDGNSLTLEQVVQVARKHAEVKLKDEAIAAVNASRKIIDDIVESKKVTYGVNTGFGSLVRESIPADLTRQLQENLIRTHASGFGDPFKEDEVRAIVLIRINSLLKGYSGIRLSTIETMVNMLNKGVVPHIPEKGSIGSSGDLAPLSHMVLPMLGLGRAYYKGELMAGAEAMEKAGVDVIHLEAKEGLALINGTTVLTAIGALATYDAEQLLKLADIAGALSLETHHGIIDAFDERLHIIRPQVGQLATAKNIRTLLEGSKRTVRMDEEHVQDAYTLRCIPQVHGASKDTIASVKEKVEIEINSVTDNPIITREGQAISGGNFHGEPMAQPFDYLGIGIAEIGNISERRVERLVNSNLSGLPSFLVKHPGVNSGFMIAQYAAAGLVSENKVLAHPASVDSITSCENQEDFVSMGTIAARHARDILKNSRRVVATEIMAACQAIDFDEDGRDQLAEPTRAAYDVVRQHIDFIAEDKDIEIYDELEKATDLLIDGSILEAVEGKVELNIQ